MGEADLDAIRAKRMAELRAQHGGGMQPNRNDEEEQKKKEELKNAYLVQILDQSALARLNTVKMVKPDRAEIIESMLLKMAQGGSIGRKLSDQDIVSMMQQVNSHIKPTKTTVKFDRRRAMLDDSDDDLDNL